VNEHSYHGSQTPSRHFCDAISTSPRTARIRVESEREAEFLTMNERPGHEVRLGVRKAVKHIGRRAGVPRPEMGAVLNDFEAFE
jgi:hypothetical protein